MGTSAWLVWQKGGLTQQAGPFRLYGLQLLLNLSWPAVFFRGHRLGLGLLVSAGATPLTRKNVYRCRWYSQL
jgi:tryptophan-rich sensory protein